VCFGLLSGVHVSLESLIKDIDLQTTIKDLVRWSGRSLPKEQASGIDASLLAALSVAEAVTVLQVAEAVSEKQKFSGTTEKHVLVK